VQGIASLAWGGLCHMGPRGGSRCEPSYFFPYFCTVDWGSRICELESSWVMSRRDSYTDHQQTKQCNATSFVPVVQRNLLFTSHRPIPLPCLYPQLHRPSLHLYRACLAYHVRPSLQKRQSCPKSLVVQAQQCLCLPRYLLSRPGPRQTC